MKFFLFFIIFYYLFIIINGIRYSIYDAPIWEPSDRIEIFMLSGPYPYTLDDRLKKASGKLYSLYGESHQGLGFWNKESDEKLSIEFYPQNLTSSFFPEIKFDSSTGSPVSFKWDNSAVITVTEEVDSTAWRTARLITTTQASSYNQLITYLTDNIDYFSIYQPISLEYSPLLEENIKNQNLKDNGAANITSTLIQSFDSNNFVSILIKELESYGIDFESFLPLKSTSFSYLTKQNYKDQELANSVISWPSNSLPPSDVTTWYSNLKNCYNEKLVQVEIANNQTMLTSTLFSTSTNNAGFQLFIQLIQDCYTSHYAYIYKDNNSVYNISIIIDPDTSNDDLDILDAVTPYYYQFQYHLPDISEKKSLELEAFDYFLIVFTLLLFVCTIIYLLYNLFKKKERRRISFFGDEIANRAVRGFLTDEQNCQYFLNGKSIKDIHVGNVDLSKSLNIPLLDE